MTDLANITRNYLERLDREDPEAYDALMDAILGALEERAGDPVVRRAWQLLDDHESAKVQRALAGRP